MRQTITRNGLNQPVTIDGVSASSDARGNRGNLTSDGVKSFVYDSANRLTGTGSSTLSYDPLDRMTQMVGTLGARYLYDGDEIAGVVVASTGTTIANRIVRGPGADELLVAYQGNTASTPLWSLQDPQSSIIAITDGAGTAPYTLAYDEYGRPRPGNAGRLMYTGQLWMPDFGLYHYKARAYHPGLGRFVQTDPVGYEQGMNLYAYVGLDPMNATDPSGLYGRGSGFTDGQWSRFDAAQRRAARDMDRRAQRLDRDADEVDRKAKNGSNEEKAEAATRSSAMRAGANSLRAGASALRSDGSDGYIANAVDERTYIAGGGAQNGAAYVQGNGPIMVVNKDNAAAWSPSNGMATWVVGHESLHSAGLRHQLGPNGRIAYRYGSVAQLQAFNAIRGTLLAFTNPDSLMELVYP